MAIFHIKLFNKPEWLKPEINTLEYYVHVAVLAIVTLGILQLWQGGNMFSWTNVLYSIPILTLGDIVAHSILQMD